MLDDWYLYIHALIPQIFGVPTMHHALFCVLGRGMANLDRLSGKTSKSSGH